MGGEIVDEAPGARISRPAPISSVCSAKTGMLATEREITGVTRNGKIPNRTQASDRISIPARIVAVASFACPASAERGMARKEMPKAFTKHAAASPPVRIS